MKSILHVDISTLFSPSNSGKYLLLTAFLIGIVVRIGILLEGFETLLRVYLIDDAFYYYTVSNNIAQGQGMVYNGAPTNGVQPLYTILLAPIFGLTYEFGMNVPVYVSLILLSICSVLTAVILYYIGRNLYDYRVGTLAAGIWLLNPWIIFVTYEGVGIPNQILLISLFVWYTITRLNNRKMVGRQALAVGCLLGLIFLARQDGVFLAFGFFTTIAIRRAFVQRLIQGDIRSTLFEARDLLIAGITALAVVSPWLIWTHVRVGQVTPIAASALRLWRSENYLSNVHSAIFASGRFARNYFTVADVSFLTGLLLLVAVFAGTIAAIFSNRRTFNTIARRLDFLIVSAVLYLLFYWTYTTVLRSYYSLYLSFLLTILLPLVIVILLDRFQYPTVGAALVVCLLLTSFVVGGISYHERGMNPENLLFYEAATEIDGEVPHDATIGAFQSGILEYYTPTHVVLNLDGVANPEAYRAKRAGQLSEYIYRYADCLVGFEGKLSTVRDYDTNYDRFRTFENSLNLGDYSLFCKPEIEISG